MTSDPGDSLGADAARGADGRLGHGVGSEGDDAVRAGEGQNGDLLVDDPVRGGAGRVGVGREGAGREGAGPDDAVPDGDAALSDDLWDDDLDTEGELAVERGPGPDVTGGRLVLAATPIGDPGDATLRLIRLIASADLIAAEDTRRLRRLAVALDVTPIGRVISHHEHNEEYRSAEVIETVRNGGTVLVVTDAGMPGVSDPGLRAVQAVLEAGLTVTALPGPSAALTALALSGLPTDRFCFEGFLPRTPGKRSNAIAALATESRTLIFFESPRRTAATLAAMAAGFGADRPAAVCRELTKTYEEVRRDGLGALADWAARRDVLGEVTIVVGGAPAVVPVDLADPEAADDVAALVGEVQAQVAGGQRLKEAVADVAARSGVRKRGLYDAVVQSK